MPGKQRLIYTVNDSLSGGAPDGDNLEVEISLVDGWIVKLDLLAQLSAIPTATAVILFGFGFASNPDITQEFGYDSENYFGLFSNFRLGTNDALVAHGSINEIPSQMMIIDSDWSVDASLRIVKNIRFPIAAGDLMRFRAFIYELEVNDTLTAINYTGEMTQVIKPTRW